jgi:hypothetical protein
MINKRKTLLRLEAVLEEALVSFTDDVLASEDMTWPVKDPDDPLHEVYDQVWSEVMGAMDKLVAEMAEYVGSD